MKGIVPYDEYIAFVLLSRNGGSKPPPYGVFNYRNVLEFIGGPQGLPSHTVGFYYSKMKQPRLGRDVAVKLFNYL